MTTNGRSCGVALFVWHFWFARQGEDPRSPVGIKKQRQKKLWQVLWQLSECVRSERRLGAPAAAAAAARRGKMARRSGRATSRCEEIQTHPRKMATSAVWLCLCLLFPSAEAGLYTASDQIVLLTQENVESILINSTAAMIVEFYASWCGHCVAFSPTYKALARDIKGVYRAAATFESFQSFWLSLCSLPALHSWSCSLP